MAQRRNFLYCEGPGDIVSSYAVWKHGGDFISETSVTFSGQLFEFCRREHMSLYAISHHSRAETIVDGPWTVANFPRWNIRIPKIGYEITLLLHAVRLLLLALRVRPRMILIGHGLTDVAYLPLLRLSRAKIVPMLHNTLWPEGFRPRVGLRQRIYRFVWRHFIWLTLAVSPACARQVQAIAGNVPVTVFRPSFPAKGFAEIPNPKDLTSVPFRVMFAGRIEESKGVFDILDMAQRLPRIKFSICGDGQALPEIMGQIKARGLENVTTYGKLNRPQLLERYLDANIVIVPTRSTFSEGFAMVVAEAILLLRPVITSRVVPAAEVLRGAVRLVQTDNVAEYVGAIQELSTDAVAYSKLVDNARALRPYILDDSTSFQAALGAAMLALDGLVADRAPSETLPGDDGHRLS